jgi:ABC-type antimicrobial peptide transport system permease subunit
VAAVGILAGVLGAVAATRALAGLLYGVAALDPVTFAAGALILLAAAFVAAYVPAVRSSRVDPLIAIRSD